MISPDDAAQSTESADAKTPDAAAKKSTPQRDIPGNLPYTTSHGVFKKILEKIVDAERPERFSGDFVSSVLKFSGGSARAVPPILKRIGFLNPDSSPTELYSKFKSDSARSGAARDALKKGFAELFRRNTYADRLPEGALADLVVEVTGLKKNDPVTKAIVGTFGAINGFVDQSRAGDAKGGQAETVEQKSGDNQDSRVQRDGLDHVGNLGLSYHINIVLPQTSDITVFNAIFRSLRENLL